MRKAPYKDTITLKAICDPTQIGFVNAVIDSLQGLAAVRTKDSRKGWLEFWVVPEDKDDFETLVKDLENYVYLKLVDHFEGDSEIQEVMKDQSDY